MIRRLLSIALVLAAGCSESKDSPHALSRKPLSVRGWVEDVAGAQRSETMELEIARRQSMFAATSVWVENNEFASGGVAENGAFIVLDVPPGNSVIGFNAPGAETARLVLQNMPGTADVLIPAIILENGGAKIADPKQIRVRIPGDVDKPTPTGKFAIVAGHQVPIVETPLGDLANRREYPAPPGYRPVATFK
jgi:hypothetical protein